jgi:hypothetical protein
VTVPSLMMVAPADEMVMPTEISRQAFDLLAGEKEWYDLEGGRFGLLYHPGELFDEASTVQAEFLTRDLFSRISADHGHRDMFVGPTVSGSGDVSTASWTRTLTVLTRGTGEHEGCEA